jgi:hypothetical protein
MLISVKTYVPFFKSMRVIDDDDIHGRVQAGQQQFLEDIGVFLSLWNPSIKSAKARYAAPPKEVLEWMKGKSLFASTRLCDHAEVSAEVNVDIDELKEISNTTTIEQEYIRGFAAIDVSAAIEAALVLSELALPGCINTLDGMSVVEDHNVYAVREKRSYYSLLNPEENEPRWPELKQVGLVRTLKWGKTIGYGKIAFASARVGRGLAAFTHVVALSEHREGEALFRAMQGLEAFYCDGNGDLRRQLSDKSAVWLGRWADKRNVVGKLYDVRSKFVHGSGVMEYWGHSRDAWSENEKAKSEYSFSAAFAIRLLVATLQKCIREDIYNISWGVSVETNG